MGGNHTKIESKTEVLPGLNGSINTVKWKKRKDSGQELFWVSTKKPRHFADWVFSVKTQGLKHGCSLGAEKPFSEFCSLNGEKYWSGSAGPVVLRVHVCTCVCVRLCLLGPSGGGGGVLPWIRPHPPTTTNTLHHLHTHSHVHTSSLRPLVKRCWNFLRRIGMCHTPGRPDKDKNCSPRLHEHRGPRKQTIRVEKNNNNKKPAEH